MVFTLGLSRIETFLRLYVHCFDRNSSLRYSGLIFVTDLYTSMANCRNVIIFIPGTLALVSKSL